MAFDKGIDWCFPKPCCVDRYTAINENYDILKVWVITNDSDKHIFHALTFLCCPFPGTVLCVGPIVFARAFLMVLVAFLEGTAYITNSRESMLWMLIPRWIYYSV